ncbi:ABC transporter ATP-binding protein [Leptospira sp. 201903070]|uniref:ABC transporter ATP-binding protein n=1 Tax=Leptospira ainlahdjerensis TaxID=2810033 RepID=A0ABS2UAZ7_9LEPT|nr:ABC transporter ATP-binding protein [Leptospira ainlahdjerensis]MBM9577344.1 ABC transporter ATP-binding protein [Leptospira ainlahdjerensis]
MINLQKSNSNYVKKIWFLFNESRKRKTYFMFFLIFLSMFFESFGVGIVIPLISVLTDARLLSENSFFVSLLNYIGNPKVEVLILYSMISMVVVYTIRTIFLIYLTWSQATYSSEFQAELSKSLFSKYLRQSYLFHLNRNSSELIRNTSTEVSTLVSMVQQILVLGTELITLLGISFLLVSMEPIGALIVIGLISFAGGIFFYFTKKKLLELGLARQDSESERLKHFQQGLGGVKDIKLYARETEFLNQYQVQIDRGAKVVRKYTTLLALPRLWLEYISIIGLAGLVIGILIQGKPVSDIVVLIALFGAAAFRIMPSINRILIILQNIKFSLPTIDLIYSEMADIGDESDSGSENGSIQFKSKIEAKNIHLSFGDHEILKGISLSIEKGKTVGFIGESGAGKSTFIDIFLGLLEPTEGSIYIDDVPIQKGKRSWQNLIGYVSQTIYLTDDTLRRNIAFGLSDEQIDEKAIQNAVRLAQLQSFVETTPNGLDTIVGERGVRLSGGQRQRIGIARALYHNPSVLVLDEATSSLDVETEKGVMEAINALHGVKTILIIAHRLSTLDHCDVIFKLNNGYLAEERIVSDNSK